MQFYKVEDNHSKNINSYICRPYQTRQTQIDQTLKQTSVSCKYIMIKYFLKEAYKKDKSLVRMDL